MFSRYRKRTYTAFTPVSCSGFIKEAHCTYCPHALQKPSQSVCAFGLTSWGFMVKHYIIAANKKTILAFYIDHERKRCAELREIPQLIHAIQYAVYRILRRSGIAQFRRDIVPNFIQITFGFRRILDIMLHLFSSENAPSHLQTYASLFHLQILSPEKVLS